jgi:hypothetical protein
MGLRKGGPWPVTAPSPRRHHVVTAPTERNDLRAQQPAMGEPRAAACAVEMTMSASRATV